MQAPVSGKELGMFEKEGHYVRNMVWERESGTG